MPADEVRKSKPKAGQQPCPDQHNRAETRLVLPSAADPHATDVALKEVIGKWLLPALLEKFLKERGIAPKTRFSPKPQY